MVVLLLINLLLTVFVLQSVRKFAKANDHFMLKQLALFEAAWAGFILMYCLSHFFDIMEAMNSTQTLLDVAGQERLVKLYVLCGFGILHLSIFAVLLAKLFKNSRPQLIKTL